jgi:hypothetical protein
MVTPRSKILAMEPGEAMEFPIGGEITRRTVCYYASYLGKLYGREYHMRTIKSRGVYVIFREA